ncbi:MAG TPA: tRNA (adenosine(37)-N6)-dimethylallyltransferase MiaA [Porphyromonadaceae bacterium]|nr:tRNA (adenosine(37)-N6)-dimethylallyltransferase MiaA [Porphyromonadaceae bacterium]
MKKSLIVLVGPTAIGKTKLSIYLAKQLGTEIISADSRQIYKGIPIGTATPSQEELHSVKHHFVSTLPLTQPYNAGKFEVEVLSLLENNLFKKGDIAILCGGSMLYVDAVCKGIDDFPAVDASLREELIKEFKEKGIENIQQKLKFLDPEYYDKVDLHNPQRILHALEICLQTGRTFSSFRKERRKKRPFNIIKIGLEIPREELYERINIRVEQMMQKGLLEEVKSVLQYRKCNALQTVGYKELFSYLDGELSMEQAVEKIKQNTRIYSKKQMTWFKKDKEVRWFSPSQEKEVLDFIVSSLQK